MVTELIGAELDAAVADAEGVYWFGAGDSIMTHGFDGPGSMQRYSPSTEWSQGGPIIERERIDVEHCDNRGDDAWYENNAPSDEPWRAFCGFEAYRYGATPLIAAMRAFVASKT